MRHPASRALFGHWSELKRGAALPDRNDLDPSAIGAMLQDVFILGCDAPGPWRFRVAGTRISAYAQRELRDEPFDRWWQACDRSDARRLAAAASQDAAPLIGGVGGIDSMAQRHEFELVLLPLRHGGRNGARLLGGLFPAPQTTRRHGLHVEELALLSIRSLLPAGGNAATFGAPRTDLSDALERRRSFRVIEGVAPR